MNAIDSLILNNSSRIKVRAFSSPFGRTIQILFPHIPSEDVLKPIKQIISIPGFWEHPMTGKVKKIIEVPASYDALEVAKAICKVWEESEIESSLSNRVSPGIMQEVVF